jgi:osmotically inducible protein OsmC
LNNAGFTAEAIDTEAAVTLEKVNDAWTITAIHLTTRAQVPSIDAAKFAEIAGGAKANCPLSRVLNATITMDAKLGG